MVIVKMVKLEQKLFIEISRVIRNIMTQDPNALSEPIRNQLLCDINTQ